MIRRGNRQLGLAAKFVLVGNQGSVLAGEQQLTYSLLERNRPLVRFLRVLSPCVCVQVVDDVPAADDENALVPEGRYALADFIVERWGLGLVNAELHDRNIRFRVFAESITVRFHARRLAGSMMTSGRDPVGFSRILVNPIHLEPLGRVVVIRCDEMKMFRGCARGMTKYSHVAAQQKIERLDLFRILLAIIQFGQRPHHCGTTNRHATDGRPLLENQILRKHPECFADHVEPRLPNPMAVRTFLISGIQQMTKAMFRPAISVIVSTSSQQRGNSIFVLQE